MAATEGSQGSPAKGSKAKYVVMVVILAALAYGAKVIFFPPPFRYAGTLEATKIDLSARLSSTIQTVAVQEGDHTQQDQELIHFLCDDTKVTSDLANINYNRNQKLFNAGTVSSENMDQVKNRKEDADVKMSWCSIRSPIAGTVLSRYHEPGEWVIPGTKIITLANIKDIWAFIYVPQQLIAQLAPGMKVQAFLPELNDRAFTGKILKINSEAEFTPKNVQTQSERARLVFGVKISFLGENDSEVLKPGMTIEVALPAAAK
jgi:HlyD family secretion protein